MVMLRSRPWLPSSSNDLVARTAAPVADLPITAAGAAALADELDRLVAESRRVHEVAGINLNPATNVMNPRAEAMLSAGLGTRASPPPATSPPRAPPAPPTDAGPPEVGSSVERLTALGVVTPSTFGARKSVADQVDAAPLSAPRLPSGRW